MQAKQIDVGNYHVEVKALYRPDKGRWQPILRISRSGGGKPVHQDFTQLAAVSQSEDEAIEYGLIKGRLLVEGTVIGLTI